MKIVASAAFALLLMTCAQEVSAQPAPNHSPWPAPVRDCESIESKNLGTWDEAFACPDENLLILRREDELFAYVPAEPGNPVKLLAEERIKDTEFLAAASSGPHLWLFMRPKDGSPFALDARSGKMTHFPIQGNRAHSMRPHLIPHAHGAIIQVFTDDRQGRSLDRNLPVFFWFSLQTGAVARLPSGWHLESFTADNTAAIFRNLQTEAAYGHSVQNSSHAIDIRTGKRLPEIPDLHYQAAVRWQGEFQARNLRPVMASSNFGQVAGVSVEGDVYLFNVAGINSLAAARARDGYIAFTAQADRTPGPYDFWHMEMEAGAKARLLTRNAASFAMLDGGNVIVEKYQRLRLLDWTSECYLLIPEKKAMWNVLSGVETLPPLEEVFANKDYMENKMTVRLFEGFGQGPEGGLVLCVFLHVQGDRRAGGIPASENFGPAKQWQRAILVSSAGHRYMTDQLQEGSIPNQIWIHNSGKIILAKYLWQSSTVRKVQLTEHTVQLP